VTLLGSDKYHPEEIKNGITLSPDEKVLYVTAGFGKTMRYNVRPDDTVDDGAVFIQAGNDGMKTDLKGNLYSTNAITPGEIRITSKEGKPNRRKSSRGRESFPRTSLLEMRMERPLFITACTHLFRVCLKTAGHSPRPGQTLVVKPHMIIPMERQFVAVVALTLACLLPCARAQNVDFAKTEIQTVKVADGLYVLMGGAAQGNIAVLTGSEGLFLVDSMYAPMHQKIMVALAALSPQPVRYLVNTHLHGDHTGGDEAMAKLGAVIISQENMRKRMAEQKNAPPAAALPSLTYGDHMTLHFNGEEIYIYHPEPAHTDGDSIIYFRHANVMHVGDVPASIRYPNIGVDDGGSVDGMIAAGRQVMKIANENTKLIPGHLGPVVGFKEIQQQIDMFITVRDRIMTAIKAGKTLQEVVASKPTADFDEARKAGAITPDRFVTLVYTDLARRAK